MCSSYIACKWKTCLPSPCGQFSCPPWCGVTHTSTMQAPLPGLIFWFLANHSRTAFRLGQSPFRHSGRCARFRCPVQIVAPDMSGYVSWAEIVGRDQPSCYPRESGCHHRSHPVQLAPFDSGVQAIQLSPCRDCSEEHSGLDGILRFPYSRHAAVPSSFRP